MADRSRLVENGDIIAIDLTNRTIELEVCDEELAERKSKLTTI